MTRLALVAILLVTSSPLIRAQQPTATQHDAEDLAKKLANPISDGIFTFMSVLLRIGPF